MRHQHFKTTITLSIIVRTGKTFYLLKTFLPNNRSSFFWIDRKGNFLPSNLFENTLTYLKTSIYYIAQISQSKNMHAFAKRLTSWYFYSNKSSFDDQCHHQLQQQRSCVDLFPSIINYRRKGIYFHQGNNPSRMHTV